MKSAVRVTHGLLLAMMLGCSQGADPSAPAASTAAAAAPATTPAAPPTTAPPAATAVAPSTPKAIATAEGTIPGTRIEVTELKRTSGETVTLRFTIVNESSRALHVPDVQSMVDLNGSYTVGNVHLIDLVGRKKYFTARDAEGQCVCSVYGTVKARERANHWARFPAPPEDVERLSVIFPTFAPADDVPISR